MGGGRERRERGVGYGVHTWPLARTRGVWLGVPCDSARRHCSGHQKSVYGWRFVSSRCVLEGALVLCPSDTPTTAPATDHRNALRPRHTHSLVRCHAPRRAWHALAASVVACAHRMQFNLPCTRPTTFKYSTLLRARNPNWVWRVGAHAHGQCSESHTSRDSAHIACLNTQWHARTHTHTVCVHAPTHSCTHMHTCTRTNPSLLCSDGTHLSPTFPLSHSLTSSLTRHALLPADTQQIARRA